MAKIEMPAAASGFAIDASTPVCSNGIGPGTISARKPSSDCVSGGTATCGQTIESSSGVRVIETKPSCSSSAHDGMRSPAGSRQTASVSGQDRDLHRARLRSGAKSAQERVLATCSGVSQARRAVAIP